MYNKRILVGISKGKDNIAFGGIRLVKINNNNKQLAKDLAITMHKKIKCLGLPYSGVKIIGEYNSDLDKLHLLDKLVDYINNKKGNIIVGIDMGFSLDDINYVTKKSEYIINTKGFAGKKTAEGIFASIKTYLEMNNILSPKVFLQGYGDVGRNLGKLISKMDNSRLYISCKDNSKNIINRDKFGNYLDNKQIFIKKYDVFIPCAISHVITESNINKINFKAIIGSSNNPLKDEINTAIKLKNKGIFYMPDFLINGGGMLYLIKSIKKENISFIKNIKEITKKALLDKKYDNTIEWANNIYNLNEIYATVEEIKL